MLIIPVLLLVCALSMIWIPLPRPFPPPASQGRNLVAAIVTGALGLLCVLGLVVYLISSFSQAARALDPILVPSGLSSQRYLLFGRQYHGSMQGRQVTVYYVRGQATRPALLNVYVHAVSGTRAAIGQGKPLLDCTDCPPFTSDQPALEDLKIYAEDSTWMEGLLADPVNRAALSRLLGRQDSRTFRELYVQPERLWFRCHPWEVDETQARGWFDDLLALAEASEGER
jgi:hypothetical protein